MKSFILILMLMSILLSNCKNQKMELKKIDIRQHTILHENKRAVRITLLNVYRKTGNQADPSLADLYVCKKDGEIDSMFVFGLKSISPKEIDKIRGSDFVISFDTIPKYHFINVSVPPEFKTPKNIECAFGWVVILKEG